MEKYSLQALVYRASAQLDRRDRRRLRRRLENDQEFRDTTYDELELHMRRSSNATVAAVANQAFSIQCDCDAHEVEFGIDPSNLSEFLDVIADFLINKLPKIIEALMPIIKLFLSLLLVLGLSGVASAQHVTGCEGRTRSMEGLPLWKPPAATVEMTEEEAEYAAMVCRKLRPPTVPNHVLAQLAECADGLCLVQAKSGVQSSQPQYTSSGVPIIYSGGHCPDCGTSYEDNLVLSQSMAPPTFVTATVTESVEICPDCGLPKHTTTSTVAAPRANYVTLQPARNAVRFFANEQPVRTFFSTGPLRNLISNIRMNRMERVASRVAARKGW